MREMSPFRSTLFATVALVSVALPGAACAQTRSFNVPAQPAGTGVAELGRQADTQILISADAAAGRRTNRVVGNFTTEEALDTLLEDTRLQVQRTGAGTFIIVPAPVAVSSAGNVRTKDGVPEILVVGKRNWSLNTGIERTRDDSQPFVVFKQEDIKRSGSTNLEQFLRDYLTTSASEGTAEQTASNVAANVRIQGQSRVDLRGLGDRETLILIDGRRPAKNSLGEGEFRQSLITNIPLASIERIEVLSSSASGLYGQGATGGVINVIMRRNYSGRQLSINYADTADFEAADKRIDLTVGQSLEGGRSNISLSATYRKSNPLLRGAREKFLEDNRRYILRNNPEFFSSQPPTGSTPNIRSGNGQPLRLDPQFGGTLLGSNKLFIPVGYRGVALDGIAPLLNNLGQYNIDLADSASLGGARQPLIYGIDQLGGTLALRREMTSWLTVYGEAAYSRYKSTNVINLLSGATFIPGNAPNNPFQNEIVVRAAIPGGERTQRSKNTELRALGGAIIKLPFEWQALADFSYGRTRFYQSRVFEALNTSSNTSLVNGTFDILRDLSDVSFPFVFDKLLQPDRPYQSTVHNQSLKLAGPLPLKLPGGRPVVTLNLERSEDKTNETFLVASLNEARTVQINYTPGRQQTLESAYGELRVPVIGDSNNVPLVQGFELVLAGRYEKYNGRGTSNNNRCFSTNTGLPAGTSGVLALCNITGLNLKEEEVTSSRFEPSLSAKWTVSRDIAFRGSYATGYLPPRLNELISTTGGVLVFGAKDPERGGENVGGGNSLFAIIPGIFGGNPDLRPESSRTLSFGTILTPRFVPGLRFSADYTQIKKTDNYFDPSTFLLAFGDPERQAGFETFLRLFPERYTRGPASGGFAVGPINFLDARRINLAGATVRAIDFALDYTQPLWGGRFTFASTATRNLELSSQFFPGGRVIDIIGSRPIGSKGQAVPFGNIGLKWRGVGSLGWSNDHASVGTRLRYFGRYDLFFDGALDPNNNSTSIDAQSYVDIYGSYQLTKSVMLRGGVNNVFGKKPPFVDARYSEFGDPRMTNFYLNLTADF